MKDWAEPKTFREWTRRIFTLRPLLLTFLFLGVMISEMRYDWIEALAGDYLVATNDHRPESGAIWEIGHQTTVARKTLDKLVTDKEATRREARDADNFAQIAKSIMPGQGIIVSTELFRKLYLSLPPEIAASIESPYKLLALFNEKKWDRTYFEKEDNNLSIYLLDPQNRVLHQLLIPAGILKQIDPEGIPRFESLEAVPGFANRIYPADKFFAVLDLLPEDVRRGIIPHPEVLLGNSGRIRRVAISDEVVSGYIEIGFEIGTTNRRVIVIRGNEWAVWLLRSRLEGETDKEAVL
jgi:hypothetical protein